MASVAIAVWLLAGGLSWFVALSFALTYFAARVGLDYAYTLFKHGSLRAVEETIADKFAINILPPRLDLRFLRVIVSNTGRHRGDRNERSRAWRLSRLFVHSAAERSVPLDNTWDTLTNAVATVVGAVVLGLSLFFVDPATVGAVHHWHHLLLLLAVGYLLLRLSTFGCAEALRLMLDELSSPPGEGDNLVERRLTSLQWLARIALLDFPEFLREASSQKEGRGMMLGVSGIALALLVLFSLSGFALWKLPTWVFGPT